MTANKKIPALRFKEFEGEWEEKKLGEFFTFKNGVNADKHQYGKGIKFINVLDIINNEFITYENIIGRVDISESEFKKNEVKYGDILFQRSSETREEVGQANVYFGEQSVTFGGFVIRGRAIQDYDPYFMNNLLKTKSSRKEITDKSGGSTRYNVGQETLKEVKVYLTTLQEQQKIASFLTAVDDKIQQLTKKKALLEQYKKGVMQQIFNQQIRFKDEDGKNYPDWEEKKFSEIGEIVGGGTPDTFTADLWNGGIQWFTPTEIKSKYIGQSDRTISKKGLEKSSAKLLPEGTLLLSSRATVGDVGIALKECCTNQGFQSIIVNAENINEFIYYWIIYNKNQFLRKASGSTFLEINKTEISKLKIVLPSKDEQQKIANFLKGIDNKSDLINQQLEKTKKFKKGLLQQMFV